MQMSSKSIHGFQCSDAFPRFFFSCFFWKGLSSLWPRPELSNAGSVDSERFDPNNALAKACQKPVHHIEHQYHHQTQTLELAKRNASGKNMKTYETYEFLETNSQEEADNCKKWICFTSFSLEASAMTLCPPCWIKCALEALEKSPKSLKKK